jgi:hypothetical protein
MWNNDPLLLKNVVVGHMSLPLNSTVLAIHYQDVDAKLVLMEMIHGQVLLEDIMNVWVVLEDIMNV